MKEGQQMVIVLVVVVLIAIVGVIYEQVSLRKDAQRQFPGKMMEMGDYQLHVTDLGSGEPTVVILHGAGDCSYSWIHICKEIMKFTRVVTFDRPGLGSSDNGPIPSPTHSVRELQDLMIKANVQGPIVLVGHSLGGLVARLYALKYPNQVAGLVFLDSTHEFLKDDKKFKQGFAALGWMLKLIRLISPFGITRLIGNAAGIIPMFGNERKFYQEQISSEEYNQWKSAVYRNLAGKAAEAEFKEAFSHLEEASLQLQNSRNPQFGNLPIGIVNNPGFGENWTEMQSELASRSTNSIHKISDRNGHSLQMPRPELVIDAIYHIVEQVRQHGGRTLADQNVFEERVVD